MKKIILLSIILGVLFISACDKVVEETECVSDADCATGGCSGEMCATKEKAADIITACIYKPEYDCLKLTSCKCIEGKCQWLLTQEYNDCIENLKK